MSTLDTIDFHCDVRIAEIKYSDIIEEIYLTSEGIYPGSRVRKSVRAPLGDFIECLVDDHLVTLPSTLCKRIFVYQRAGELQIRQPLNN